MPSKNSFNKPKNQILRAQKAKNASRSQKVHTYIPKPTSSELYKKAKIDKVSAVTNKKKSLTTETLSNKKLKKIERNLKHLKNNGIESKILIELEAQKQSEIDVDEQLVSKVQTLKDQSSFVRDALWSVIDDADNSVHMETNGDGTTLGYQGFY